MKPGALILGIIVSALLLVAAGVLYFLAGGGNAAQYRASIDLVRQAQQLSSNWSIEIARVRADPLADFDSLAAFIPRMTRLKTSLAGASRRIPELPDRLASDIQVFLSALDAKEERIERFKTGYAVVRNSTRYLPLAAANVTGQAVEAGDDALAQRIAVLAQDMNLYLATPSEAGRERLGADMATLREASVAYPPPLANALANLLAHAEVLLERQAPTDLLFEEATSSEISDLADRLSGSLHFELGRNETHATRYERGVLAAFGVLVLFWIGLGVQQRARAGDAEAQTLAGSTETDADAPRFESLPAITLDDAVDGTPPHEPADAALAPGLGAERAMHYGYLAGRAGETLAAAAGRVAVRMDTLRETHERIRTALAGSDLMMELPDGADVDEDIDAGTAIAGHVRREVNAMADIARRLASFSALPNGDVERDMVDVNACIAEVVATTGAERAARVAQRLGDIPEIFASRTEIRLLLAQLLENSMRAVEGLEDRKPSIKIDTAPRDEDIVITVIDNGAGIGPERRGQIFRPFYTSRNGAMGLGLTLAADLVKKYGGGIRVNSLPDRGTVARITLPTGTPGP